MRPVAPPRPPAPLPDLPPSAVALVHDWLNGMRGGERCLELIADLFPGAPIHTLLYVPDAVSDRIRSHPVRPSALRFLPFFRAKYRYYLPFFPRAIERVRLPADLRLLISTSHCVAKGAIPPPSARHLCYCFTPMRYAWVLQDDYFGTAASFRRRLVDPFLRRLRDWDRAASARVHRFVAISRYIQTRIRDFYQRDSVVVYPPVDTDFFTPAPACAITADSSEISEKSPPPDFPADLPPSLLRTGYDLVVSALVPYKRVDLAIDAARITGRPLVIAGAGSEIAALRARAPANVHFAGRPDDAAIRALYRHCRVLLFPGVEDFGIVPLEAQACGRPVIAYAKGGALETVLDATTGLFFHEQTPEALADAIRRSDSVAWSPAAIRAHAETFAIPRFLDAIREQIALTLSAPPL